MLLPRLPTTGLSRNGPSGGGRMGTHMHNFGMLDRDSSDDARLAPPGATPTLDSHPRRLADFPTLGDALDYAAQGVRGMNFHDARGALTRAYPYAELRDDALANARRF